MDKVLNREGILSHENNNTVFQFYGDKPTKVICENSEKMCNENCTENINLQKSMHDFLLSTVPVYDGDEVVKYVYRTAYMQEIIKQGIAAFILEDLQNYAKSLGETYSGSPLEKTPSSTIVKSNDKSSKSRRNERRVSNSKTTVAKKLIYGEKEEKIVSNVTDDEKIFIRKTVPTKRVSDSSYIIQSKKIKQEVDEAMLSEPSFDELSSKRFTDSPIVTDKIKQEFNMTDVSISDQESFGYNQTETVSKFRRLSDSSCTIRSKKIKQEIDSMNISLPSQQTFANVKYESDEMLTKCFMMSIVSQFMDISLIDSDMWEMLFKKLNEYVKIEMKKPENAIITNPRMARTTKTKKTITDPHYWLKRERNNQAAKKSRDAKKRREILTKLCMKFFDEEIHRRM